MKFNHLSMALLLCGSLFLQSCTSLSSSLTDDAFAHAVKSGNHVETMHRMMPHHGKLEIQEVNGKWYHPLQYSIASGDEEASFALIERSSPTRFDGRSLAYNAARVNHNDLAKSFAAAGYGSQQDISQAYADARAERAANQRASAAAMVLGCVFIAALMGSSSRGQQNGSTDRTADWVQTKNAQAESAGLGRPY